MNAQADEADGYFQRQKLTGKVVAPDWTEFSYDSILDGKFWMSGNGFMILPLSFWIASVLAICCSRISWSLGVKVQATQLDQTLGLSQFPYR